MDSQLGVEIAVLASGWLFGIIVLVYHLKYGRQKEPPKTFKEFASEVIERLDDFWDNPHFRRRVEKGWGDFIDKLAKWWEEDEEEEEKKEDASD